MFSKCFEKKQQNNHLKLCVASTALRLMTTYVSSKFLVCFIFFPSVKKWKNGETYSKRLFKCNQSKCGGIFFSTQQKNANQCEIITLRNKHELSSCINYWSAMQRISISENLFVRLVFPLFCAFEAFTSRKKRKIVSLKSILKMFILTQRSTRPFKSNK